MLSDIKKLPIAIEEILTLSDQILKVAKKFSKSDVESIFSLLEDESPFDKEK